MVSLVLFDETLFVLRDSMRVLLLASSAACCPCVMFSSPEKSVKGRHPRPVTDGKQVE